MKKQAPNKYVQWAILYGLFTIGFIALLVIAGDEDPRHPVSDAYFFGVKGAAAAVAYACYRIGRYLHSLGLLPEWDKQSAEEGEDLYD